MISALFKSIPALFASILVKSMSEKFLARVLFIGLTYLASKSETKVDDELVEAFRQAYYGTDEVKAG